MNLIVAAGEGWGIGRDGRLLARIPGDMAFFRRTTLHKVVVMGRATLESLPGGKGLKDRVNIVLSRDEGFEAPGALVCRGLDELQGALAAYDDQDVYVIGGESVYRQLLPYCARAYVTRFLTQSPIEADRFLPDLDREPGWQLVEASEPHQEEGVRYRFCEYTNTCARRIGDVTEQATR